MFEHVSNFVTAFDCLIVGYIANICLQFDILTKRFNEFISEIENDQLNNLANEEILIKEFFKQFIEGHNLVYEYV